MYKYSKVSPIIQFNHLAYCTITARLYIFVMTVGLLEYHQCRRSSSTSFTEVKVAIPQRNNNQLQINAVKVNLHRDKSRHVGLLA